MRMRRTEPAARMVALTIGLALAATPAAAYVGPGLGLGVIAAALGGIAAFFMMLAGLVWYPVKIMLRKRREKKDAASASTAATAAPPQAPDSSVSG